MSVSRSAILLAVWLFASSANATLLRYEAALHEASWQTESSPLVCRLSHEIGLYGKAEFVRYAGRGIYLSINVGSRGDNYTLSRERARVVREYLIARNVPVGKISFDYYGEHKPLHSNRTAKGRAANRRVLVQLTK